MFQLRMCVSIAAILILAVALSCCSVLRFGSASVYEDDECWGPDGKGVCKSLYQCEPLFGLVKANSRPPTCAVDYLKKFTCGYVGKTPVVCCPNAKNPSVDENQTVEKHSEGFLDKSCGTIQTIDKVVGGSATGPHEFPWMVHIGYPTISGFGLEFRCGGSLISSRHVLTAAHCVSTLGNVHPTVVKLGEDGVGSSEDCEDDNDCSSSATNIPIEKLIPHPDYYRPALINDIALIRLAKRVKFENYIRPICLPLREEFSERALQNGRAVVTGWGRSELGDSTRELRKVFLSIVPLSECSKVYKRRIRIRESHICAGGEDGKDSCSGDSGGPLQVIGVNPSGQPAYIQQGVVSFGPKICGTKGMPGVYTKVAHYVDWIVENVKE